MKRRMIFLCTLMSAVLAVLFCFGACKQNVKLDGDYVMITVTEAEENTTLLAYMEKMREEGQLTFTADDTGFITSIDGKENADDWSYCWMVYTSDETMASTTYTVEYDGKTYGQASVGAATLIVAKGETYIWWYQPF